MSATHELDALRGSLERLEQILELPYISGELKSWTDESLRALEQVESALQTAIESDHPSAFKTMVKNHRNLQQQVEKLAQEDAQLLPAVQSLRGHAQHFASSIDEMSQSGQQFQARREQLVNDGLALILRVRKQQSAIDTWLGEALQRDNGVGD